MSADESTVGLRLVAFGALAALAAFVPLALVVPFFGNGTSCSAVDVIDGEYGSLLIVSMASNMAKSVAMYGCAPVGDPADGIDSADCGVIERL